MNHPPRGALQRSALFICILACFFSAFPSAATAQAPQICTTGTISEITFDRQKPFLPEATSEDASMGGVFRFLNSIHVATTEGTIRWELLFEEGDCLDPALLQESERNLRTLPYMAEARIRSQQLADGSHRVDVMTLDGWALTLGFVLEVEGGFQVTGFSASAKNLFGTGTGVGYFRNTFRERQRIGGQARQPNLFGTRVDGIFHGGSTRSGNYFSQSFFRPFTGEVGDNAFRQSAHKRDDYFGYSVEPSLGYTQALIRFEAEQYEAMYERRFGDDVGMRFMAGLGFSREVVRFPFGAAGTQIVLDDDFSQPMDAPPEVGAEISSQIRDHATNRMTFTVGVRSLRFRTKLGLDALRATQDIQVGTDLTLTVAPGLPWGDDNASDVLTRVQGATGFTGGNFYVLVGADFQARNVRDDDGGGPTGWRDMLFEVNGTGYWTFSETSTLVSRLLYTSGSKMDRPFQLTLGGREAVRAYDEDAFPGAKRVLATLEQRIPFPGLSLSFLDLGLAGFIDAGKVWGGDVPFGATSDWEAGVGVGLRIGIPAGGQSILRVDLGVPLTGQREEKGVVFRLYTELFGLLDRRAWPTQTERSRWYGVDPDLTVRPENPLATN
jgi:hypothetical protein